MAARGGIVIFRRFVPSFLQPGKCGGVYTHPYISGQGSSISISRHLYTAAALGLDPYQKLRESTSIRFANMQEGFMKRMKDLLAAEDKAMIFTEDFKNVLHLAQANEEDMGLVREMACRFNKQHEGLRFGMYIFGPVVMRTYHTLKQPQQALEAIKDPQLSGFFDQIISYQLAMDLLYKTEHYSEVLQVFDMVQERRIGGVRYPKSCLNLAIAACYKMNSQDSLTHLEGLLEKMQEYGIPLNRRVLVFGAALALSTGHPHTALDFIMRCKSVTHISVRSIKVMALSHLGRVEDALITLRAIMEIDVPAPARSNQGKFILREAVEAVDEAVKETGNKENQVEFARISKCLEEGDVISEKPLEEIVCQPIDKFEKIPGQDRAMLAASFSHSNDRQGYRHGGQRSRPPRRKGLMDME